VKTSAVFERFTYAGELAKGLAHEARLDPDEGVAHLAFDLGLRDQGSDGVEDHAVHAAGADQGLGDLERVLAVSG